LISWCSYCQRFIGEDPPFADLALTHGVCTSCRRDPLLMKRDVSPRTREIAGFFGDFVSGAIEGKLPEAGEIRRAGEELGIRPVDLLLGVVQPTLCEIGRRFASGEVPSQREHQLSLRVQELLEDFANRLDTSAAGGPRVLLGPAPGNTHRIGVLIFTHVLADAGLRVEVLPLRGRTWTSMMADAPYDCVGLSIALPTQLPEAIRIAEEVQRAQPRALTLLGGYATKESVLDRLELFDRVCDPTDSLGETRELLRLLEARPEQPA
jgi:methanogenic corrinoid protein MtbC1